MTGWSARLAWAAERVSPVVAWALAGIFAILLAATAAVWALGRLRPEADWTELRQRVRTWWIMAAVFALAMVLSRRVSLVFFAFVSFLALKEYLSLIPTRRADGDRKTYVEELRGRMQVLAAEGHLAEWL
jgi:phosphatidate cytidylyltransferase